MRLSQFKTVIALTLLLTLASVHGSRARPNENEPLSEKMVLTLVEIGIDDVTIASRIRTGGIDFDADDSVRKRLKQAGASGVVLAAIDSAKASTSHHSSPTITFDQLVTLLELRISEDQILSKLRQSPTVFTLDVQQVAQLKLLNASDELINFMQGKRLHTSQSNSTEMSDLVMILDCSASMGELTPDGHSKMDAAKNVLSELIDDIPPGLKVAFLVYGHDKKLGCNAVQVVRSLSELNESDKAEMIRYINHLQPAGNTPIALALRTAGKELQKVRGTAGVALITDGKEMCHGNPSAEAAKLAKNSSLVFGISVIGLGLNTEEQAAVRAIATAGNGKFYSAETTEQLAKRFTKIVSVAPRVSLNSANRRAVKVVAPSTLPMPSLGRIAVTKVGAAGPGEYGYHPEMEVPAYNREIRLVSGEQKYDIFWLPKNGKYVRMVKAFSIPNRQIVEIRPENYVGMVRVNGTGLPAPKTIAFTTPDKPGPASYGYKRIGQTAKAYGEDFVIPAGVWDLWIVPADGTPQFRLEQKLEIRPGVLNIVE